jgi:hypothetical protein
MTEQTIQELKDEVKKLTERNAYLEQINEEYKFIQAHPNMTFTYKCHV